MSVLTWVVAGCSGPGAPADPSTPSSTPSTSSPSTPSTSPTVPVPVHSDGDCLTDAEEAALGTDPTDEDSDDDGLDDCAESACTSDPLDPAEVCYACGWPHGDPGTLASTGNGVGDVVADLTLWDQCVEPLRLWDLYGAHVLVFSTTQWCGTCLEEAQALAEDTAELEAATGAEIVPVIALFQDVLGNAPLDTVGADYAEALSLEGFPVTADQVAATLTALPYDGGTLPGKCLLSPELVILGCHEGDGGTDTLEAWIQAEP